MEKRFKDLPDTRIVMVGTSPYDETVQLKENVPFKTKNETIKRIVEYQKESAAKNNWEFTDLNAPMVALNQQNQQKDPAFTLCGSDRIHPDNDGHMVMAYLFLKAQGFVGKEVAEMEINANKKQAVKAENCTISNIKKNGKRFELLTIWQRLFLILWILLLVDGDKKKVRQKLRKSFLLWMK